GGSQLTLEVQPAGEITRVKSEQLEAVKVVLDRRVNGLGVAESTLQTIGEDQLVLQLPGEQDPSRAAKVLGSTALLEFRAQKPGTESELRNLTRLRAQARAILVAKQNRAKTGEVPKEDELDQEQLQAAQKVLGLQGSSGSEIQQLEQLLDKVNEQIVLSFEPAALTGKDLVTAGRQQQANDPGWEVTLSFNREGGDKFAELTQSIAGTGRLLGIVLDGRAISEASVGEQFKAAGITGGAATITGNFSAEDARDLEVQLRGGSLPL
ncbi:MAG: protein translocase subunit SecD, partial [Prochlorococcus sp.]|nr:protein translocase subunit SecD [Prochlorococcus sp.]